MKLSLKMIAEKLEHKAGILKFKDIYSTLRLGRPIFLTNEEELKADTLYISPAQKLSDNLKYSEGCALIIIGDSTTDILNAPAAILVDESMDIFSVFNCVSEIYDFFDEWQAKLEYISGHYGKLTAFEKFLDASTDVFENLIAVSDTSFNYMTSSRHPVSSAAKYSFEKLPDDVLAILKKNPAHRMLNCEKEIFVASDPEFPHRVMIRNIFHENSVIYRVTVSETQRPFRETDYLFLEFLATYLEQALRREYDIPVSDTSTITGIFLNAIISGSWARHALETELEKISWHVNDKYMIFLINADSQSLFSDSIPYYCSEIIKDFPGVLAFNHKSNMIILANTDFFSSNPENDEFSLEDNVPQLVEFIRSNNLSAGVSNIFNNIYDLKKFYRQADIALEIGASSKPDIQIHKFSDYILPYMFRMSTSEFTNEDLLSPIFVRLKKYDMENNSEYLKTLKEYLTQNMNAVQTASTLYIHRATLIYRMKRICEIGKTDLKDPDELLHLALSFTLSNE